MKLTALLSVAGRVTELLRVRLAFVYHLALYQAELVRVSPNYGFEPWTSRCDTALPLDSDSSASTWARTL